MGVKLEIYESALVCSVLVKLTYVNKCGRDDDTGTKLLQDKKDQVKFAGHHLVQQDRAKDTQGTCGQDNKEQTNAEADVVISLSRLTG
jgi:hypothetical protein